MFKDVTMIHEVALAGCWLIEGYEKLGFVLDENGVLPIGEMSRRRRPLRHRDCKPYLDGHRGCAFDLPQVRPLKLKLHHQCGASPLAGRMMSSHVRLDLTTIDKAIIALAGTLEFIT
jgi:hypothetical protein